MRSFWFPRAAGIVGLAALTCGLTGVAISSAVASGPAPGSGHSLPAGTRFFVERPSTGAVQQESQLFADHDVRDAFRLAKMLATPQAAWFTGDTAQGQPQTPQQIEMQVRQTTFQAALERTVPVLVAYDIPGRDCGEYSAGGALNEQAYEQWVSGFAQGIGNHPAVVIVEPDALGNMPSDCLAANSALTSTNYPFTDAERFAEVDYAVNALEADPNVSVYLDGTNPDWQNVGNISQRLVEAGVQDTQGFFLNVSNYQYTANSIDYGTWISDCIAYATVVSPSNYSNCPSQYWNGGPSGTEIATLLGAWTGVALSPFGVWSTSTTTADLNTSGITAQYASLLGTTTASTHFVIDTSRNGQGPNDMQTYAAAPYNQASSVISKLVSGNWCNPTGAGLGLVPTANTGAPLVDAYLWAKIPGESDGQCDAAGGVRAWDYSEYSAAGWPTAASDQALFDPLWGLVDPVAGSWFPQQALQLIGDADQSASDPQNQ
jgi:endoglucanase